MTESEIKKMISCGEDSRMQFKRQFDSASALAAEIVAFANSLGGVILVGVDDNGAIFGLTDDRARNFNQLLSSACSQKIEPALQVLTQNIIVGDKLLVVLEVPRGNNKFYIANGTDVWVKYGADKRRAKREDLQRLLQESSNLFADEQPIEGSSRSELDKDKYLPFLKKRLEREIEPEAALSFLCALKAANRMGEITLGGLLLFGYSHSERLRSFGIGAVAWYGNDLAGNDFRDSEDIFGSVRKLYADGIAFIKRQLRKVQAHPNFNYEGVMEIPDDALQEALVNAIVHRNYFIQGRIRVMVFDDRVEIISPGALPNSIDVDSIKLGMHIPRNPVLVSCIRDIDGIPYRGMGTGIARIMRVCAEQGVPVDFINEISINQFKVIFHRKQLD